LALKSLRDPKILEVLYGGAKGGGKTVLGCMWLFSECVELIRQFQLKPSKYPVPVAFMGRKQSVDMNDTTLETWKAVIPQSHYRIASQDKEIIVLETVKIQYGGFDKTETVNKFQSSEYVKLFLDQAEELTRDDYAFAKGTLRKKINDQEPMYKVLLTANPAEGWLKDEFITTRSETREFIKALPTDNPFLSSGYITRLREAFQHRPELTEAYINGNWDVLGADDLVIKSGWLDQAQAKKELGERDSRKLVACDVARFGKDETVIYAFEGAKVIDSLIYGQRSTMETAGNIQAMLRKYGADICIVDADGVGGGVVDRLRELGVKVLEFHGSAKPSEELETRFLNKRAEAWWKTADRFAKGSVVLHSDVKCRNQLADIRYKTHSNGSIKIESKDDIVKRLGGESPDRGDCFVLGIYGLEFVTRDEREVFRKSYDPRARAKTQANYGWNRGHRQTSLHAFAR